MTRPFTARSPIAIYDSGAGGIGLLQEVQRLLPAEQLLYFADAANAPYGDRGHDALFALITRQAARLLSKSKALVLACNTATAVAAEGLRTAFPGRIIIGIEPALRPAVRRGDASTVWVLATAATLSEARFLSLCHREGRGARVIPIAAPGIVPLVEAGLADSPAMQEYLSGLFAPYRALPPDAVVLGCTHFPFAKKAIQGVLGREIAFFDGNRGTARELRRRLLAAGLLAPKEGIGRVVLTASDPCRLGLYRTLFGG